EGGDSWFYITVDYSFGHEAQALSEKIVTAASGKVVGSVTHSTGTADVSPFILQALASKAKIVGLVEVGFDLQNLTKGAAEFGLSKSQKIVALALQLNDIDAIGLHTAQGLLSSDAFYWDADDKTREFSKRFSARAGKPPASTQAAVYSAVTHYLKA